MKIFKEIVAPIAVLTAICLVISAALALTYQATKPIIDQGNENKANEARGVVLPGAGAFTKLEGVDSAEVYRENSGLGVVITTTATGYGGELVLMAGLTDDGEITGVKVLSHGETPGFGAKLAEDSYGKTYEGKTGDDYEQVDGIAGSTITSKAYKQALANVFAAFEQVKGDLAG